MAGFIGLAVSDTYLGSHTATQEMENGVFVELDHTDKTGTLAGADAQDVYFVVNENDTVSALAIDTLDFRIKEGDFLRAHKPQAGEILVTTAIDAGLVEGDEVGITADGKVGKVEADPLFVVHEMTGEFAVDTARLLVL